MADHPSWCDPGHCLVEEVGPAFLRRHKSAPVVVSCSGRVSAWLEQTPGGPVVVSIIGGAALHPSLVLSLSVQLAALARTAQACDDR